MTKHFTAKLCGHGCTSVPAADRRNPELSLETETRTRSRLLYDRTEVAEAGAVKRCSLFYLLKNGQDPASRDQELHGQAG